jgi:uncharacterized protein YjbI with pentapeptide repeats
MNNKLQNIIENYRSGLLSTPNIQARKETFSDEIIEFVGTIGSILAFSSFRNSSLINMEFINVNFESGYFENCIFKNCIFKNTIFTAADFENCVLKNCQFSHCSFSDVDGLETIFNECTFVRSDFNNAVFESCHFIKPIFEGVKEGPIGSATIIDTKFSNSKKSLEFKGEMFFLEIFDQIDKLYLD